LTDNDVGRQWCWHSCCWQTMMLTFMLLTDNDVDRSEVTARTI